VHYAETQFGDAYLISVHDSITAANWIDNHWDDAAFTNLRKRGYGGPVAMLLSPHEAAIGMFGNATNGILRRLQTLANTANFPVVLLPLSHDPISCMMYVYHDCQNVR
jgi:hypothetical protein